MPKGSIPFKERRKRREENWRAQNTILCECGCGQLTEHRGSRFVHGHHMRFAKYSLKGTGTPIVNCCVQCSKNFVAKAGPRHKQKYCSNHCKHLARRRRIKLLCVVCRKEFEIRFSDKGRRKFCTMTCKRKFWDEKVRTGDTTHYRRTAYATYKRECARCGWQEHPEVLVVHHEDENRKNSDPSNLTVLCPTCHAVVHFLRGARHLPASTMNRGGTRAD